MNEKNKINVLENTQSSLLRTLYIRTYYSRMMVHLYVISKSTWTNIYWDIKRSKLKMKINAVELYLCTIGMYKSWVTITQYFVLYGTF